MDRAIPEFNAVIIAREVKKNRMRHKSRLREVAASVD